MKYKERIAELLANLIKTVPYNKREGRVHSAVKMVGSISGTALKCRTDDLLDVLDIEFVLFGTWGECGMAIFLDSNLKEVVRVAFENSDSTVHAWLLEDES